MAEENGFVTGDARVDAALKRMQERNDARFSALEDALLVQVHLESRLGRQMKEHAEWLVAHEKEQAERDRRIDQRMEDLGERIDKLVSGIGNLVNRIPPENLR